MPVIGTQQSPIRIIVEQTIKANLTGHLAFQYDRPLSGVFQGDNFVFNVDRQSNGAEDTDGKTIVAGGDQWVIRKIHIHSPAEHVVIQSATDPDVFEPFECHLVHSRPGDVFGRGPKLVVGVFFRIVEKLPRGAKPRETLYGLDRALADTTGRGPRQRVAEECSHAVDPRDFLPEEKSLHRFFKYEGSLTSEPFSEDVSWYVMAAEAHVLKGAVDEIELRAEQEARPVHAVDRRFVLRSF